MTKLSKYTILRSWIPIYIPYIILYSIYIQLNGEVSPGGGFQAGVIFASGLIAFDLLYGVKALNNQITPKTLIVGGIIGILIYAGTGLVSLFFETNYLNYSILASTQKAGQHLGIFLVEIGVGVTVTSIMCLIYSEIR